MMDAFDAQLVAEMPGLRRWCVSLAKTPWAADDLMQGTAVRAIASRDSFLMGTNMKAWLCFIARNLFYSDKRRAWRMVEMGEGQAERVPQAASAIHALELRELFQALSYLPEEQRDALLAVGLEGEDYESAAEMLGCSTGTVKSRVSRGRDALDVFFRAA